MEAVYRTCTNRVQLGVSVELKWTDENEAHIARHAVSPQEVEEAVSSKPLVATRGRGGTTVVFGTTFAGRYLLVVLAESADGRWYVVTARDMTLQETRAFRRRK